MRTNQHIVTWTTPDPFYDWEKPTSTRHYFYEDKTFLVVAVLEPENGFKMVLTITDTGNLRWCLATELLKRGKYDE